jgi:lipopolysaccharide heptosyltransferase II
LRIATMKVIDEQVGKLLCSLGSRLVPAKPAAMPAVDTVRTIAIVKFWGMGSIVLMTPAIALLREKYPQARITFVTQAANRGIVGLLDGIDDSLTLEVGKGPGAFLGSLAKLVMDVRARRFDLWLDFEFLTRFSAILTGVSGARVAAGYHAPEIARGDFHHVRVPFNNYWHITDNFCALASGDLEPASFERPLQRIVATEAATMSVASKLEAAGLRPDEPYVILNPNAGELALERRWSVDRFARLADELLQTFPGRVVTVGAPAERGYVAGMVNAVATRDRLIDMAGQTSLDELVALFAGARLMVSNDTGPLHLASAVGTPTVAIFGPETPSLFGPRGPQHRILYKNLACSPCLNIYNGRSVNCRFTTTHCVADITVIEVLAAARAQLASHKRTNGAPEAHGA